MPVGGYERAQRRSIQQRHVGAEHHNGAVEVIREAAQRDLDRSSGTGDLVLVDNHRVRRLLGHRSSNGVTFMPDHHEDVCRTQLIGGGQHMTDQRDAGDRVQHLRLGGLHSRALPGSQDDDRET